MKTNLKLKALALAVMTLVGTSSALADQFIANEANVFITGNTDSSGGSEGVFIRSNGGSAAAYADFSTNGTATISSATTVINGNNTATLRSGASSVQVTSAGMASINANGIALRTANTGVTLYQDTAALVATQGVRINAESSSTGSVAIGNGSAANAITGTTNAIAGTTNTITGTTNTITGTTNTITGTTNTITGTTSINAGFNAATSINTGNSTGMVTIGNAANVTNINSGTNNMGVGYASTNNIGTGAFASTTAIGNTQAATTVNAAAGNASQSLANNLASTNVSGGASALTSPTVTPSSQVRISNIDGATVDANGKLASTGAGNNATAGITVTNGYGNVNGVVATERQASISGGTSPATATTMSMNDNGARFSNARSGAPVTVTGVADGRNDYDAVNVRQFAGAVAAVAAQANVPALAAGQTRTLGLGVGSFMGKAGVALGMNIRGEGNATYKLSVSTGLNGGSQTVLGAGAAWSF